MHVRLIIMVLGTTNHFVALMVSGVWIVTECHKPNSNHAHFICAGLKIS